MVDLNFHKVIKYFFSIFFFFLFSSKSFSENFTFKKLADLNDPWGSSFINNEESKDVEDPAAFATAFFGDGSGQELEEAG